ncbi:hypothetical protein P154DRAFT_537946 [Amniculicola lignicola CBS 123094]|uniref:Uncharacterized protein n=1 Tax=Amniculicola lignicola CBS 123094 TaxID=1392246 RepID=A0A6A5W557_9PLEO|nr:hypothetical protein P154DRAFT_537946 [Amniculicola lignicola CBS 123094]
MAYVPSLPSKSFLPSPPLSSLQHPPALIPTAKLHAAHLISMYDPWPDTFPSLSDAESYVQEVCAWKNYEYGLPPWATLAQKKKAERAVAYQVALEAYKRREFRLEVPLIQREVLTDLLKNEAKRLLSLDIPWPRRFQTLAHARKHISIFSYNVRFQYEKIPGTPLWRMVGWVTHHAAVMAWEGGAFGLERVPGGGEERLGKGKWKGMGEMITIQNMNKKGVEVGMDGGIGEKVGLVDRPSASKGSDERISRIKQEIGRLTSNHHKPNDQVPVPVNANTSNTVNTPSINEQKQAREPFVATAGPIASVERDLCGARHTATSTATTESLQETDLGSTSDLAFQSIPSDHSISDLTSIMIPNLMFFSDSESDSEEFGSVKAIKDQGFNVSLPTSLLPFEFGFHTQLHRQFQSQFHFHPSLSTPASFPPQCYTPVAISPLLSANQPGTLTK